MNKITIKDFLIELYHQVCVDYNITGNVSGGGDSGGIDVYFDEGDEKTVIQTVKDDIRTYIQNELDGEYKSFAGDYTVNLDLTYDNNEKQIIMSGNETGENYTFITSKTMNIKDVYKHFGIFDLFDLYIFGYDESSYDDVQLDIYDNFMDIYIEDINEHYIKIIEKFVDDMIKDIEPSDYMSEWKIEANSNLDDVVANQGIVFNYYEKLYEEKRFDFSIKEIIECNE